MTGQVEEPMVNKELVMFYNVENLFSPDPRPQHWSDPTVSGLRNWDQHRYQNKLRKLAHVFRMVEEEEGVLPMIVGLSEVYEEQNLQDLVAQEPLKGKYGIVHYESLDERGVDTALLYDKRKLKLLKSEALTFAFEKEFPGREPLDTTRDVLYCRLQYGQELLNVFVLHLPSKREKDINKPRRDFILKVLKEKIEKEHSHEAVIVCGDFNENPTEENIHQMLFDARGIRLLENPFVDLYHQRMYSTYHNRQGLLFDQVLVSPHFFLPDSELRLSKARVFRTEKLCSREKRFKERPFRTYAGTRYLGGYSDHFPVWIELQKRN